MSEREYKVGTFVDERGRVSGYVRDYSPAWKGCIVYDVQGVTGSEAKKKAIVLRKRHEFGKAAVEFVKRGGCNP